MKKTFKYFIIPAYFFGEAIFESIYEMVFDAPDDKTTIAGEVAPPWLIVATMVIMSAASISEGMIFGGAGSISMRCLGITLLLRMLAHIPSTMVVIEWSCLHSSRT